MNETLRTVQNLGGVALRTVWRAGRAGARLVPPAAGLAAQALRRVRSNAAATPPQSPDVAAAAPPSGASPSSPPAPPAPTSPLTPTPTPTPSRVVPQADALVEREEAAAAAEAAAIGGRVPHDAADPAMEPVYEAGGGEQDGWEMAEADLIENATHGGGHGNPLLDALSPEAEADRVTAVGGEGDHVDSSRVDEDDQGPAKPVHPE